MIRRPAGFCHLPGQAVRAGVLEGARPGPFEPPPAPRARGRVTPPGCLPARGCAPLLRPERGPRPVGPAGPAAGAPPVWCASAAARRPRWRRRPPAPCAPGLGPPPVRPAAGATSPRPTAGGRPGKAASWTGASWRAPSAPSPEPPAAREAAAAAGAAWRARGTGPGSPGRAPARPGPHPPGWPPPHGHRAGKAKAPPRARRLRAPGRPRAAESRGKGRGGSGSTPRCERTLHSRSALAL